MWRSVEFTVKRNGINLNIRWAHYIDAIMELILDLIGFGKSAGNVMFDDE